MECKTTEQQYIKDLREQLPAVCMVKDIMWALRTSKNATYNLFQQEDFPAVRIGNTYRVSRDAFLRWLEKE